MCIKRILPRRSQAVQDSSVPRADLQWIVAILILAAALSGFTVYEQVFHRMGLKYLWDEQLRFHRWVIEGTSIDPWQYRILAPFLIEGLHSGMELLGLTPSYGVIFFAIRMVQNFAIFTIAAFYFRKLSLTHLQTVFALVALAWGLTYSGYGSNLAFDTYFDVLFYLLMSYCLFHKKTAWAIPLSVASALNRETGILMPLMPIAISIMLGPRLSIARSKLLIGVFSLVLFIATLVSVRAIFGPRPFLHTADPGLSLFLRNASDFMTYYSLFATYSVIPLIALIRHKQWPQFLRRTFWLLVPLWLLIHPFTSILSEARLFLVPYVIVLLPGAFIQRTLENASGSSQEDMFS